MSRIYTYTQCSDSEFEECAQALEPVSIPIEQTPKWGTFDDSLPERTFLGSFRYDDDDRLVALASATLYQQKGRDWIWIKHGPLFAVEPNTETIKKMCSTLKEQFSFVNSIKPLFMRLSSPHKVGPLVMPFEHTMYDETVVVDLTKTKDEILAEMSQGGRRGIRKAEKENLDVHEYSGDEASQIFRSFCYQILEETASRDGFGAHPANLYTTLLEKLSDYAKLYVIKKGAQVLAWAVTTEYGSQALYYYGGSTQQARELHAPYLLHWEIMKAMKYRDNKTYDFMGIAGKHYPSLANVTQFKLKFSKNIIKVRPTYDLPLQRTRYKLLSLALKTKRKVN